jgi:hypothetical protein
MSFQVEGDRHRVFGNFFNGNVILRSVIGVLTREKMFVSAFLLGVIVIVFAVKRVVENAFLRFLI